MFVHWTYAPHTVDGVVGKDNPLLLASNFSGTWPGLVALLNTGASLESVGRAASRIWTDARRLDRRRRVHGAARRVVHDRADRLSDRRDHAAPARSAPRRSALAARVEDGIRRRRVLALMLGDTSMGMINGYFGPRLLYPIGFSEHKVDQAWLIERDAGRSATRGWTTRFDSSRTGASPFTGRKPTPPTSRPRPPASSFEATSPSSTCSTNSRPTAWAGSTSSGCLKLLPPSDFAEGLLNSHARPEGNGTVVITSTEADQGNLVPMELMKRLLEAKGLPGAVMFHDVRWGAVTTAGSSGCCSTREAAAPMPSITTSTSLRGVHSYRQPAGYFPVPGGTFAGVSLPGPITWARAWIDRTGRLVMDLGRGESVALPEDVRETWWRGTTRQWPFMAADLGCSMETIMAHYMSNHIAVAYGDIFGEMAALSRSLGFKVRVLSGFQQSNGAALCSPG